MPNLAEIAEKQLHDPLYLKSVTELGDDHTLVTTRDVCSSTGIKLISRGTRFDSSLYQKLLQHKLAPPLDQCLSIENAVTSASLAEQFPSFLTKDNWLYPIQSAVADKAIFSQVLEKVRLHPAVAFKLTVMRENRPELFRHSIYLALVCIYVGIRHGLGTDQLVKLATAALLHDIGLLHIDPNLLARNHNLSDAERRHLYAHPLTAWLILKDCSDYPQEILDAVLHHHERLDGSGYPSGLHDHAIGLYGRILAVAEIVASRHGDPNSAFEKMRLEAILKLNSRRYGHQLIGYLDIFYRSDAEVPTCTKLDKQAIRNQLNSTLHAISNWEALWNMHYQGYHNFDIINKRMESLKMEMMDAGLSPQDVAGSLHDIEESPRTCFEMHILLDEINWQLNGILDEIKRRWPALGSEAPSSCSAQILNWLIETERSIKPARAANKDRTARETQVRDQELSQQ